MSDIVDQSLIKIVKGTTLVFFGTVISMPLTFASKLIIIRYTTTTEYGMYALAMVVLNILVLIAMLGLQEGVARYIAYYHGKKEDAKIRNTIFFSVKTTFITSSVFFLILFVFSDVISTHIFHNPEFSTPLRLFSIAVPFLVLIDVLVSFFRGFGRIEPRIYFPIMVRNSVYIVLLSVSIYLHTHFLGVIYAYLTSLVITFLSLAVYAVKNLPLPPKKLEKVEKSKKGSAPIRKELLLFSLPLLSVTMLNMVMHWTDTLMLGYVKTSDVVGLYNAALPLARLIPIALSSSTFIFIPIISELYAKGLLQEMKRMYQVLTKWIFSAAIPIFFVLFLFPSPVLHFLFGSLYVQAAIALQILSLSFMVHTFVGLNGLTLTVMGKTRFVMAVSLIGAVLNVILNAVLIPSLGITGAALAFFSSCCTVNVVSSIKLYNISAIHPFTRNYVKPLVTSIILITVLYGVVSQLHVEFFMLPLFLLAFLVSYCLLLLLTKSFDKEDIQMLLAIERKAGVDLGTVKTILKRFV